LFLAWGLGLNLSLGRLRSPSQGAVDNGAACAILLGLAERLQQGVIQLRKTQVTIALFTGEEVNMQGSKAYVKSRQWPLPAIALNLEVMAQNGEYVYWEQDGDSLHLAPTALDVNRVIAQAVTEVAGEGARPAGPVNSDGGSFMRAGIPATTLGTYDRILRDGGFHLPSDNLERVVIERLPQGVEILIRFIEKYEGGEARIPQQ
jgi:Zn-dependent M28 family amino/carboxypeptidase